MSADRKPPMSKERPKRKTPAENAERFDAHQKQLKEEAAARAKARADAAAKDAKS